MSVIIIIIISILSVIIIVIIILTIIMTDFSETLADRKASIGDGIHAAGWALELDGNC